MAFAIKYNDKYLRFGSYSLATPVDLPENATLYSKLAHVKHRLMKDKHYYLTHPIKRPRQRVETADLKVVEIQFTFTESPVDVSKG